MSASESSRATGEKPVLYSTLETMPIASADRRVSYVARAHFEAPNWSRDGSYFLFNQDGGIYRLAVSGGEPSRINTDPQVKCNNDHGISPDGTMLAISDSNGDGQIASVHGADCGRNVEEDYAGGAFVLAWVVAGRVDAGACWAARRQLRYLHGSGKWRRGEAAYDGAGAG
jgi:dipeptidyl aminopeptidase/acylaminoacyl peptidase